MSSRSKAALLVAIVTAVLGLTGAMAAQQDGRAIFRGKGNCFVCHGQDGKGTALAPNLTDATWLQVDGSAEAIVGLVKTGVAKPKKHPAPMPPMGGAKLSEAEVQAVAAYVHSLSAAAAQS